MTNTPRLALPELAASQSQKHVTHNEALLEIDALSSAAILDRDLSDPPGSPSDGDTYLVKATGTGAWAGQDGKLAYAIDGGWRFYAPFKGLIAYVADETKLLFYDGSAWADLASVVRLENLSMLGVNATADATNKLSVASAAILLSHIGNGIQLKMNKNAAGDTASLLYQDNFSGRAEMGLAGDDDLHVKVSPDGSSWFEALTLARASGLVSLIGDPTPALHAATKQYVDAVPGLLNVQRFVAGTWTYTPTPGTKSILVLLAGAGGGGGGALASAGTLSAGSGGGSGNTLFGFFTGADVTTQSVVVGAGGAGGDATGSDASAGGATSFGSLMTANGGSGGKGDASAGTTPNIIGGGAGGSTGTGTGILFSRHGLIGQPSIRLSGTVGISGGGATSGMFMPADGGNARTSSAAGQTGGNAGCGGSGGLSNSATGRAGGAGGTGECLVLEFH